VPGADRRHLYDLSVDQLDPILVRQDADLGHPVIFVHGEPTFRQRDRHRPPPEGILRWAQVRVSVQISIRKKGRSEAARIGRISVLTT
jgi:hypothetical protein